jgi:hypothetical protein
VKIARTWRSVGNIAKSELCACMHVRKHHTYTFHTCVRTGIHTCTYHSIHTYTYSNRCSWDPEDTVVHDICRTEGYEKLLKRLRIKPYQDQKFSFNPKTGLMYRKTVVPTEEVCAYMRARAYVMLLFLGTFQFVKCRELHTSTLIKDCIEHSDKRLHTFRRLFRVIMLIYICVCVCRFF